MLIVASLFNILVVFYKKYGWNLAYRLKGYLERTKYFVKIQEAQQINSKLSNVR